MAHGLGWVHNTSSDYPFIHFPKRGFEDFGIYFCVFVGKSRTGFVLGVIIIIILMVKKKLTSCDSFSLCVCGFFFNNSDSLEMPAETFDVK